MPKGEQAGAGATGAGSASAGAAGTGNTSAGAASTGNASSGAAGREGAITLGEFVQVLWDEFERKLGRKAEVHGDDLPGKGAEASFGAVEGFGDILSLARRHGWVEPQDVTLAEQPIHRNDAARIVHEFLRRELGEADEENWDAAKGLKDLYDCRACVAHVAQVFAKGIMEAQSGDAGMPGTAAPAEIFGMRRTITQDEAEMIAVRTVWKERRLETSRLEEQKSGLENAVVSKAVPGGADMLGTTGQAQKAQFHATRITSVEADALRASRQDLLCIDVRTAGEYATGHRDGFVNVPLMKLLENPQALSDDKAKTILLECDGGYRSEIAANCLESEGYSQVYYYGL
ncbi:MAG: rhodanese-like domain-containing protein [Lachnospiraceae bacterium]|nr:rhodanese-like domain-containing protein [Lachnospiraceae bacterium]